MVPIARQISDTEKIRELVDASYACRYGDLATMLGHSTAAMALVEAVQKELPEQLVASVWTQHGNALRVIGDFAEAESLLGRQPRSRSVT
jgi:hypothetical protein